MTIGNWLESAGKKLNFTGIKTARLDAVVLLEDQLGRDRALLLARPELELTVEQQKVLDEQVTRRASHVPLAYIRHKSEFYGREFYVDERVLEPRPESETMIDLLKSLPTLGTVIDVGTGSGALIITAARELQDCDFVAIDIDQNCLDVAAQNAQNHDVKVTFHRGDLLGPVAGSRLKEPTALLCNLPYVPDNFHINTAATHEPKIALFGGPDGLDLYRRLFDQINSLVAKPSYVLTESLPPQHEVLNQIAQGRGYRQTKEDDFIQLFEPAV